MNLGNCSLAKGEQQKAKQLYTLALDNDASCVEALYNLGKCIYPNQTLNSRADWIIKGLIIKSGALDSVG